MNWMKSGVLGKATRIETSPYPHIVIPECLPWDIYEELSATFPEQEILPESYDEGVRIDLHSRQALDRLDGLWHSFIEYHTSQAFWHQVYALFQEAIYSIYTPMTWEKPETWRCAPRGTPGAFLQMECQPGVNTPQTFAGRVRGPHLDNPIELYGALLYMGEGEGGDLEVQRLVKQPRYHGKLEIEDDCVETVATVPYQPNMFVMFLNTPTSVHAVTPRPATDQCRRLVNITGELPGQLFKTGHGRY
jgi:hypothetical protein